MRRLLKKTVFFLSVGALVSSLFSVFQYWDYDEVLADLSKEIHVKVSADNFNNEIETAINNSNFDDARMYLDIAKSSQYPLDYLKYQDEINRKDTRLQRIVTNISSFTKGFVKGKSNNIAGVAGSVTADFTVIGDGRDLYHQYQLYDSGEEMNELVAILSGVGIGLTVVTIVSGGSAAPAKGGVSLIKLASRTQRISGRFQKVLLKQGRKIFDWPLFTRLIKHNKSINKIQHAAKQAYHPEAIKPLREMANQVDNIRKSSSTIDVLHLLKYVESSDDLRQLEKVTAKYGTKTKGFMKLLGKGALRTVRILRKTSALIISLLSSILSALFSVFLLFTSRSSVY